MRFEELGTVSVIDASHSYRAARVLEICQVVVLVMNLRNEPFSELFLPSCWSFCTRDLILAYL
jgi:hypothetical protein